MTGSGAECRVLWVTDSKTKVHACGEKQKTMSDERRFGLFDNLQRESGPNQVTGEPSPPNRQV